MSVGRDGELLFQQRMEQKGYEVIDVSDNPEYYDKGDFIVKSPFSGQEKIFEVKTDTKIHKTENLYLEVATRFSDGIGWWEKCEADYLVYVDYVNKEFYIFSLLELRERVKTLPKNYAECYGDSIGLLVSLNSVKDLYKKL